MKLVSVNKELTIETTESLAEKLKFAMDIYYETVMSISKQKKFEGTVNPMVTKLFKGIRIVLFKGKSEYGTETSIASVEVSSFGVDIFFSGENDSMTISYDSIKKKLK